MALAVLLLAGCGQAAPPPTFGTMDSGPTVLVPAAEGQHAYGGVARVRIGNTCSGVLLEADLYADGPAYVLTNGHCARAFGSDEVLLDQPGSGTVTFNYFHDAAQRPSFAVRRLWFSTMKGTDLAILELEAGYRDLRQAGIRGFELERARPVVDEPVVVVGAPLVADPSQSFLRLASCRLEGEVPLVLERHWHWFDFWRNGCRDIVPGSSGSPVISRQTGRVLGLINTTTIGSEGVTDCWLGRPCEVAGATGASPEGASYAAPVAGLTACFATGVLDRGLPGCPLDDGRQLALRPSWAGPRNPARGGAAAARWNVAVDGDAFPSFRYKIGPAESIDCRDPRGYGAPRRVTALSRIEDALPEAEGHYALCVLGDKGIVSGGASQDPAHASMVTLEIDRTPPRLPAEFRVLDFGPSWGLVPVYTPPEISAYAIKFGELADTTCGNPGGYRPLLISPFTIPKTGAAVRFCAIGMDLADNPTPPLEMLLQ
jgi:hypothetical protein